MHQNEKVSPSFACGFQERQTYHLKLLYRYREKLKIYFYYFNHPTHNIHQKTIFK
ncbi:hypothetical protein PROVRUST_06886 [Providencia rustigianii DSM 4541]|uniref:Uncharacterized protein n=1 Tax=Providencia rustigianii DSM 4541 TaxID=500637 RepID=D1P3L5_9GAMM|nr:hypothetical protein PROVRUST_06886 [Providencia rustigianii DSM 4541]